MKKPIFIYHRRNCVTIRMVNFAIQYYQDWLGEELTEKERAKVEKMIEQLTAKRETFQQQQDQLIPFDNIVGFNYEPRKVLYYMVLTNIARFLETDQGEPMPYVETIFKALLGALYQEDRFWSMDMYTNLVEFPNCLTHDERVVYILHHAVRTGLHSAKDIIKVINMLFKLLNIIDAQKHTGIIVPNRRKASFFPAIKSTSSTERFDQLVTLS